MKVTIFKNVYDKTAPHHIPLHQALERIQSGRSSTLVSDIRDGDKTKKQKLPVVCFSGEFSSRSDDALFEHSGFVVLDFDHVDVDSTKAARHVMIRDIVDKKFISHSNLTIDEHKKQYKK